MSSFRGAHLLFPQLSAFHSMGRCHSCSSAVTGFGSENGLTFKIALTHPCLGHLCGLSKCTTEISPPVLGGSAPPSWRHPSAGVHCRLQLHGAAEAAVPAFGSPLGLGILQTSQTFPISSAAQSVSWCCANWHSTALFG